MKNTLFLTFTLLLSFQNGYGQDTLKVLFIGNSLTYYNDMPNILKDFFIGSQKNIKIYQKTDPGINLNQHVKEITGTNVSYQNFKLNLNTFEKEKFDYIIIQEATVRLLVPEFRAIFYENVQFFSGIAKKNNSKLFFYQPYPLQKYPQKYCFPNPKNQEIFCSDEFVNSTQELMIYKDVCDKIKKGYNANIIPIGETFEYILKTFPTIQLLSDNEHPSVIGSSVIAYLIFREVVGSEPNLENLKTKLPEKDIILKILNDLKINRKKFD